MARVKRAVNAHKKRRTTLELASGYRGQRSRLYRKAKEQMLHSLNYAYRDRRAEGRLPAAVDHPDQRGRPRERHDLQPLHPGPQGSGCRGRPQGPRRDRDQRPHRLHRTRRRRQSQRGRADRRAGRHGGLSRTGRGPHPQDAPPGTDRTPRVVAARKLLRRVGRDRAGRFLVEGAQAVARGAALVGNAVRQGPRAVRHRCRRGAASRAARHGPPDRSPGQPGHRSRRRLALRDRVPAGCRRRLRPARRRARRRARRSTGDGRGLRRRGRPRQRSAP